MFRRMALFVLISLLILSFDALAGGPNLNPGKWEITTETEMVGMPMKVPPVTHTQCLTVKDIVPQSEGESKECQVSDIKVSGDTVSWKIVCSGQGGEMEGTGRITYSGDRMEGTMDMAIKGAGMQVKNKISGRRTGDCD